MVKSVKNKKKEEPCLGGKDQTYLNLIYSKKKEHGIPEIFDSATSCRRCIGDTTKPRRVGDLQIGGRNGESP